IAGRLPGVYRYAMGGWVPFCIPSIGCFQTPVAPDDDASWLTVNVVPEPGVINIIEGPSSNASGSYTLSWQSASNVNRYEIREQFNSGVWTQVYNGSQTSVNLQG